MGYLKIKKCLCGLSFKSKNHKWIQGSAKEQKFIKHQWTIKQNVDLDPKLQNIEQIDISINSLILHSLT